jgi:hypothetical protein
MDDVAARDFKGGISAVAYLGGPSRPAGALFVVMKQIDAEWDDDR